jgi:hypothetical protein
LNPESIIHPSHVTGPITTLVNNAGNVVLTEKNGFGPV